jgi:hypothetical protein
LLVIAKPLPRTAWLYRHAGRASSGVEMLPGTLPSYPYLSKFCSTDVWKGPHMPHLPPPSAPCSLFRVVRHSLSFLLPTCCCFLRVPGRLAGFTPLATKAVPVDHGTLRWAKREQTGGSCHFRGISSSSDGLFDVRIDLEPVANVDSVVVQHRLIVHGHHNVVRFNVDRCTTGIMEHSQFAYKRVLSAQLDDVDADCLPHLANGGSNRLEHLQHQPCGLSYKFVTIERQFKHVDPSRPNSDEWNCGFNI